MARKQDREPSVPAAAEPAYDVIVGLADGFCQAHLTREYQMLCRKLTLWDVQARFWRAVATTGIEQEGATRHGHKRLLLARTESSSAWTNGFRSPKTSR